MSERYYLDTSALIKRYVNEPGSLMVDDIFERAHRGIATIACSFWNIGEAAVVLDKYGEKLGLNVAEVFKTMLREIRMLCKAHAAILPNVTPKIIKESTKLIFKHHIYIADALQIATAKHIAAPKLITGDKKLAKISEIEGLETLFLG